MIVVLLQTALTQYLALLRLQVVALAVLLLLVMAQPVGLAVAVTVMQKPAGQQVRLAKEVQAVTAQILQLTSQLSAVVGVEQAQPEGHLVAIHAAQAAMEQPQAFPAHPLLMLAAAAADPETPQADMEQGEQAAAGMGLTTAT